MISCLVSKLFDRLEFSLITVRHLIHLLLFFLLYQVLIGNAGVRWVDSSIVSLKQAAEEGDSYAKGFLALCYVHGDKGLDISFTEAHYLARESASNGHWLGDFVLGYLYSRPPIGPERKLTLKHYLNSFRHNDGKVIKLAAQNDPVALYVLGEIFTQDELSSYVPTDLEMATQYFELSSLHEYPLACLQLGLVKIHGIANLTKLDTQAYQMQGIQLLKKAVDKKLPAAHHYLARCYLEGTGVMADPEMAVIHFQAAADRNFGLSQLVLANFYEQGVVGPVNLKKALEYAQMALEQGTEGAISKVEHLTNILNKIDSKDTINSEGENFASSPKKNELKQPITNEFDISEPIIESTALILPPTYSSRGKDDATVALDKVVVSPSKESSDKKLNFSGQNNFEKKTNAKGLREEAKRLYWSKSSNSLEQAKKIFELSAGMGDAESARYLGMMYLQGKGVAKSTDNALKWFEIASEGGDAMAKRNLDSLKRIIR